MTPFSQKLGVKKRPILGLKELEIDSGVSNMAIEHVRAFIHPAQLNMILSTVREYSFLLESLQK